MEVKELLVTNPTVSIIMPMYNAQSVLKETVDSVLYQSYTNWELIIVDDCSTDNSLEYAKQLSIVEPKIKVYSMITNSGPGAATKYGCEKASGGLVAFLDSDDLWVPNKLKKQIEYMLENNYEFVCSDYEQISEDGQKLHKVIKCRKKADYKTVLRLCPIGSSTVIITASLLMKIDIPIIRKNNDHALWLKILKEYPFVYGMNEILMLYRIWPQSNSFNKFNMVKYFWKVFREYEQFSFFKSLVLLTQWIFIKIVKIK